MMPQRVVPSVSFGSGERTIDRIRQQVRQVPLPAGSKRNDAQSPWAVVTPRPTALQVAVVAGRGGSISRALTVLTDTAASRPGQLRPDRTSVRSGPGGESGSVIIHLVDRAEWPPELCAREINVLQKAFGALGPEAGRQYRLQGVAIEPQTMLGPHRQLVLGQALQGGRIAEVALARHPDSKAWDFVFKRPRPGVTHGGVQAAGIDTKHAREIERAIGVTAVCRLLGFSVIPETTVGTDAQHRLGLVMPFIAGLPSDQLQAPHWREALTRKRLVDLQLLDALVGNVDRCYRNILISVGTSGTAGANVRAVWGIDNDASFAPLKDPNALRWVPIGTRGIARFMRGVALPEVVDRHQVAAFRRLQPPALRDALSSLIPERDIRACLKRFARICTHLERLTKAGHAIEADEWDLGFVGRRLRDPDTSYVGRGQRDSLAPHGYRLGSLDALPFPCKPQRVFRRKPAPLPQPQSKPQAHPT